MPRRKSELPSMKDRLHEFRTSEPKREFSPKAAKLVSNARRAESRTGTLSMADIAAVVSAYFCLGNNEIISRRRQSWIIKARHIAAYFCCELTPNSYPKIGNFFGNDHTTAMHARRKINMHITKLERKEDLAIKWYVDQLAVIFKDWGNDRKQMDAS